jgi:thiosulfate/3-mercaptopyruvate sulfurtransferase
MLVSTEELSRNLAGWRLFDCRHDLARPDWGEAEYRKAHIPGAVFASLDRDLSAPKNGRNGRHPLPEPEVFAQWLSSVGLQPTDRVVCYDASNGAMAARLWWLLRWLGHEDVAVLDGGFAKWTREGLPVTSELPSFPATSYPDEIDGNRAVGARTIQRNLNGLFLLDARSPARWRGEQEPIDPEAGRIPGALNRFNGDNVNADGTFKDSVSLKNDFLKILGSKNPSEVIHYCGSGVAACHNLLAMEVAGLPGGRLYAGSWSEWIADPSRPREKG